MVLAAANNGLELAYRGNTDSVVQYATADTFYKNALVEILNGVVSPLGVAGAGAQFLGICINPEVTILNGTRTVGVNVDGAKLIKYAVTGVSAATDVDRQVYATTDDTASLTLTRASADCIPVGKVSRWYSSTLCDVQFYTREEAAAVVASGSGRRVVWAGRLSSFINGYLIGSATTGVRLFGSGRISFVDMRVGTVPANDADTTTITLKINDTAVPTFTATYLASANQTLGLEVATITQPANPATTGNVFHDGDLLQIAATSGTPDGALDVVIYADPQ